MLLYVAYPAIYCLEEKKFPRPATGSEISLCETPDLLPGLNFNFAEKILHYLIFSWKTRSRGTVVGCFQPI